MANKKQQTAQAIEKSNDMESYLYEQKLLRDREISDSLTDEEKVELHLKWGVFYSDAECIQMETTYRQYLEEYEMSADREQILKNICKTALKMDQALDEGNIREYKDLSSVFDQLRKSGRFTDSQKKELKERDIDSLGQLVAFVEHEGGIIPHTNEPDDEPQDRIDFMIQDMKTYVDNLVKNELGLGNLIETYISKVEKQENNMKAAQLRIDSNKTGDVFMETQQSMVNSLADPTSAVALDSLLLDGPSHQKATLEQDILDPKVPKETNLTSMDTLESSLYKDDTHAVFTGEDW